MKNKKYLLFFLILLCLSFIFLVYAQSFDSGKLVLDNNYNNNQVRGEIISSNNLSVGDVFYLDDGRKARVTGVEDIASDFNFDNLNFFANGVLVHNKVKVDIGIPGVPRYKIEFGALEVPENAGKVYTVEQLTMINFREGGFPIFEGGAYGLSRDAITTQLTQTNRFAGHLTFLRNNEGIIDSFADFGSALPCGAVPSQEVAAVLPKAKVYAIDVVGDFSKNIGNVQPLKVNFVKSPLPFKVKVARYTYVNGYLSSDDAYSALRNIYDSIEDGGYLLSEEYIFQKTSQGFKIIDWAPYKASQGFTITWNRECNKCVVTLHDS